MNRTTRTLLGGATVGAGGYLGLVTGAMPLDLGIGRRTRPLGPLTVSVAAAAETVYDVLCAPYAERPSRAMREKVEVLERGEDLVLAAHRTPLGIGLVATTTETVKFLRPHRMEFRLVRGPVPHVVEAFTLTERDGVTTVEYTGELGTDLWGLGRRWGDVVARAWVETVRRSLEAARNEAERRSAR